MMRYIISIIHRNADKILASLARNPSTSVVAFQWARETATNTYIDQIHALIKDKTGLRFSAKHCTAQSLKEFDIVGLAEQMNAKAPHLWELHCNLYLEPARSLLQFYLHKIAYFFDCPGASNHYGK
jgi:hypothetical protein